MIPVLIPSLPETDAIVPYLRRIDEAHIYSNYGPLTKAFTDRLCRFISAQSGGGPVDAALTSNGTTAIELALRYRSAGRTGRICVMPSWTFIATAHAAANVGLMPYFTDVDPLTLALTPEIAARALSANPGDVAAVIVVSPCGAPIEIGAWEAFEEEHGVPVIFDAAAAGLNLRHVGAQPLCISLHATKALGIGEGGAIKRWGVSYRGMDPARQDINVWGKVTKKYEEGGEALLDLDVGVAQPDGTQTTPGTATVALPKK